ncbi:NAD(P)/FAD-dependent oxidoreductase [Streptomyces griseus]|uniref:flavin monoamine oxidase family protein n=1 Tax=Streptomyces griseus TaxID=1911 RepID=UPI00068D2AC3|nr:NAD(P)/FAD-dependent oxidoreductase [Streptomyces griseus]
MAFHTAPVAPPGTPRTRRTVLKAAGLAALTATAAAVTAAPALAEDARPSEPYDVIVIGAGFAGVTAARAVRAQGLRVLLLEARDRIGGRTWTGTFAGEQVEMGGAWVHPVHPRVWHEIHSRGIPLVADDTPPDRLILPSATTGAYAPYDPATAGTRLGELLTDYFAGSETYFPSPHDPLLRADLLAEPDRLTLRDRLLQLRLSPQDEAWLAGHTATAGGSNTRGAYTALVRQLALSGDLATYNGLNTYRPVTGMTGLLTAMLADQPVTLRLASPVTTVTDTGTHVQVDVRGGRRHTARAVVVAVPANVWHTIAFRPGLPAEFTSASTAGIAVPHAKKIWMKVRGDVGRFLAQGAETGSPLIGVVPHTALADGSRLMIGFSLDPALDPAAVPQVQAALRQFVPQATVEAVRAQDWGNDPYARGGWSFMRPLQLTRQLRTLQQPHGRLVFAGSDIAAGWSGFVEGAIESGAHAARLALETATRTPARRRLLTA